MIHEPPLQRSADSIPEDSEVILRTEKLVKIYNGRSVVNGVDILATLLSLQTTVAAQQDAIAMLSLNNTLLEAELAAFQVRMRSSYLTLSSKQKKGERRPRRLCLDIVIVIDTYTVLLT